MLVLLNNKYPLLPASSKQHRVVQTVLLTNVRTEDEVLVLRVVLKMDGGPWWAASAVCTRSSLAATRASSMSRALCGASASSCPTSRSSWMPADSVMCMDAICTQHHAHMLCAGVYTAARCQMIVCHSRVAVRKRC